MSRKYLSRNPGISDTWYQLTPETWDDGTVMAEMPHAPSAGRVEFDAQQWREWWAKK